jgi:PKD repeat protein
MHGDMGNTFLTIPLGWLRIPIYLVCLLLLTFLCSLPAAPAPTPPFRPGRLLVQPRQTADLAQLNHIHASQRIHLKHQFPAIKRLQILEVPDTTDIAKLVALYQHSGLVEFVEPDYWVYPALAPNDPYYLAGNLWHLHNYGQTGGIVNADIHALAGWETVNYASNIIVAVVDTGIRFTHEDLAPNIWVNPGEIPGNGLDDDNDGFVDDVYGVNTAAPGPPTDKYGHGTEVAGVLAAVGNNGLGVCGVAWGLKMMACRFYTEANTASISDLIPCLDYARHKGAHLINASFTTTTYSASLSNALVSCRNAGIIVVASAGNEGANNDNPSLADYPASFNLDNIVSVAAATAQDSLAPTSNYGAKSVDLAAPGESIYTTRMLADNDYSKQSGTSFSTPMVAGALALMKVRFPSDSYRQLIDRLLAATDPLPDLAGRCVSGGRLNLARALGPITAGFVPSATNGFAPLTLNFTNTSFCTSGNFLWDFGDGATSAAVHPAHTFNAAGTFSVRLTARSPVTAVTNTQTLHITLLPRPALAVLALDPFTLQLLGQPAQTYLLEASDDLRLWTPAATNATGPDGQWTFAERPPQAPRRFYRARLEF